MRILHLVDSRAFGGIESHIQALTEALKQRRLDVAVLLWNDYGDHPLESFTRHAGIPLLKGNGQPGTALRLIRQWQPDVLHTHGYKANLMGRLLRFFCPFRLVCTFHNGDLGSGRMRWYTSLDRLTAWLSTNIAVSRPIRDRLWPLPARYIPNFIRVDAQTIPSQPMRSDKTLRVAFAGRLSEVKNPRLFVETARQTPELLFEVFGEGELREELATTAPGNLKFRGWVSSMTPHWADLDVLLITSHDEGLPMVALEAMAHGVIVISTAVGEMPFLIDHSTNGLLSAPTPEEFSQSLLWVSRDRCLRQSLRIQALKTVKDQFEVDHVLPRILELYA